jgi:diadenylate cyclase
MDWITQVWGFIRPILDILILSALIYQIYKVLVQTRAIQLVKGGVIIALIYVVAYFLKLSTLLWIMNSLATVFVIIIAIVFQPELRNIFTRIGRGEWFSYGRSGKPHHLDTVLNAAEILAGRRRGGLLVFARQVVIRNVIDSGTKLSADLSSSLILTIFGHDTPLHDGAVIIKGGKILSAGCMLPLSEQVDIRRSFGTRHRAALGMAEDTDAVVLVVSEETGAVSLAYDANLYYDLSMEEIRKTLKELLSLREESLEKREEALFED